MPCEDVGSGAIFTVLGLTKWGNDVATFFAGDENIYSGGIAEILFS